MSIFPRQVKIHAIFEDLEFDWEMHEDEYEYWRSREPIRFRSPTKTPAVMQACRESRACLKESGDRGRGGYTKAFTGGSDPIYTWVNFAVDTIWTNLHYDVVLREEHERIIRLGLHCGSGADSQFFGEDWLIRYIANSTVKELTVAETGPTISYQDVWLLVSISD
ncbi:hypothetical protein PG984_013957 [Apiospora sp. TS-2023a]